MKKILPLAATLALAFTLTGCNATSQPTPSPSTSASATASHSATPIDAPVRALDLSKDELEKLPWVSTYTVYARADVQADPGTPFRNAVASVKKGSTYAVAYTKPGGPAFALIGTDELSDKTALPVIGKQAGWVQVLIPGRLHLPSSGKHVNGVTAWLQEADVALHEQTTELSVDLSADEVTLQEDGQEVASYSIVMDGGDLTPANLRGFAVSKYFTVDGQKCSSQKTLATSIQSEKADKFVDGASVLAIHGWSKECRAVSAQTTRSSGCINLSDQSMQELLRRVKPGTPITFKR